MDGSVALFYIYLFMVDVAEYARLTFDSVCISNAMHQMTRIIAECS